MVGKKTKYLTTTIAKGGHLNAVLSSAKHARKSGTNENSFAAISDVVDQDENKDALDELPLQELQNCAHFKKFFAIKSERTADMKDMRRYLHAIRVYYGFNTTEAFESAHRSYYFFPCKNHVLPNLWTNDDCWYLERSKLVKIRVPGRQAGKIGIFGF